MQQPPPPPYGYPPPNQYPPPPQGYPQYPNYTPPPPPAQGGYPTPGYPPQGYPPQGYPQQPGYVPPAQYPQQPPGYYPPQNYPHQQYPPSYPTGAQYVPQGQNYTNVQIRIRPNCYLCGGTGYYMKKNKRKQCKDCLWAMGVCLKCNGTGFNKKGKVCKCRSYKIYC